MLYLELLQADLGGWHVSSQIQSEYSQGQLHAVAGVSMPWK